MKGIEYIGEWAWAGQLGHGLVILAFVAAILACWSLFKGEQGTRSQRSDAADWIKLGRAAFLTHILSILSIIGLIFFLMIEKRYEYQYVQQHVSDDLPYKYLLSAFWEGQEGSFLLWMFWHVILGFVIWFRRDTWSVPVLSVFSAIQVIITSMLLGHYWGFGDWAFKMGSSPFMLLREVMQAPIFQQPDYVSKLKGNGLNPLLQNYWMTIHPPTLFLGFASTAIPFCYAIAALWRKEHKSWLNPVLKWSLFSGAVLGLGVLMGGAWAYEALSFGGYWAWDPVENMSLVPWIILVGAIHTTLVAKATNHSIKATYVFYLLTFLGVVYSTFLTRSGVLGDTSVHAFTEMGLEWQLVIFLSAFTLLGFGMFFYRRKGIPVPEKEEALASKEFWMFIGTLVLLFSALLITFSTSVPVFNKLIDFAGKIVGSDFTEWHRTTPADVIGHHNRYQLWIGVFMGLFSGVAQFLRFRESDFSLRRNKVLRQTGISAALAAAGTFLFSFWIHMPTWPFWLLCFTGFFTLICNLYFLFDLKGSRAKWMASVLSHAGFGVMILGILASGLEKQFISNNLFAQEGLIEGFNPDDYRKNILLMRDAPMIMGDYEVTYFNDSLDHLTRSFDVKYTKLDKYKKPTSESFVLSPNVLYDKSGSKIAASNPATKRYLTHDVFTHVSSLPRAEMDRDFAHQLEDSLAYTPYLAMLGDTFYTDKYYAVIESSSDRPGFKGYKPVDGDIALGLHIAFHRLGTDSVYYADPMAVARGNEVSYFPAQVTGLPMRVRIGEQALSAYYPPQDAWKVEQIEIKPEESAPLGDKKIKISGITKDPKGLGYEPMANDIALSTQISVEMPNGKTETVEPIYFIRESQPGSIPARLSDGSLIVLSKVDPQKGSFTIEHRHAERKPMEIEIADKAPRNDYIVMQAIVFPGINLFWLGSLVMLLGLAISWIQRRRKVVVKDLD
jgi:cytochrome c-type biogenesis protein CcmF